MADWHIIYRLSDGKRISEADDPARITDPLPAGFAVQEVDHRPDWGKEQWNPAGLKLEAIIDPADPLKAVAAKAPAVWTEADKLVLSNYLKSIGKG